MAATGTYGPCVSLDGRAIENESRRAGVEDRHDGLGMIRGPWATVADAGKETISS